MSLPISGIFSHSYAPTTHAETKRSQRGVAILITRPTKLLSINLKELHILLGNDTTKVIQLITRLMIC